MEFNVSRYPKLIERNYLMGYIVLGLYFISLFVKDMAFENQIPDDISKILKLLALCIFIVKILCHNYVKGYKIFILTVLLTGVLLLTSGDLVFVLLAFFSYNSYKNKDEDLYKFCMNAMIFLSIITIILFVVGVVPDVLTYRSASDMTPRHSLGFLHSANLPMNIFYIIAFYFMGNERKINKSILFFMMLISVILFWVCRSNNAIMGTVLLMMYFLIINKCKNTRKLAKIMYFIAKNIFLIISVFSISSIILRANGIGMDLWNFMDKIFTNRTYLGEKAYKQMGIEFISSMSTAEFVEKDIVLDNGYLYITFRYGIYALILLLILGRALSQRYKNNLVALGVICIVAFVNFTDNDFFSCGFLPFLLVGMKQIYESKSIIKEWRTEINERTREA